MAKAKPIPPAEPPGCPKCRVPMARETERVSTLESVPVWKCPGCGFTRPVAHILPERFPR